MGVDVEVLSAVVCYLFDGLSEELEDELVGYVISFAA